MEIQAKLVLLVIGVIVLAAVTVDFIRRRRMVRVRGSIDSNNELLRTVVVEKTNRRIPPSISSHSKAVEPIDHLDHDFSLDPVADVQPEIAAPTKSEVAPEPLPVNITLTVMARQAEGFSGAELATALTKAHCHCVDGVFVRYVGAYGEGEVWFRIVQAVEPGLFDIENISTANIPGITFIIMPQLVEQAEEAFEKLVRTAKQIAFMLNGELLDADRCALTLDKLSEYREQIKAL